MHRKETELNALQHILDKQKRRIAEPLFINRMIFLMRGDRREHYMHQAKYLECLYNMSANALRERDTHRACHYIIILENIMRKLESEKDDFDVISNEFI